MQKNVPEIKWLIVLLEKEVKNTQKSISDQKKKKDLKLHLETEIWIWSGYYTSSGFSRKSHSDKVKIAFVHL